MKLKFIIDKNKKDPSLKDVTIMVTNENSQTPLIFTDLKFGISIRNKQTNKSAN